MNLLLFTILVAKLLCTEGSSFLQDESVVSETLSNPTMAASPSDVMTSSIQKQALRRKAQEALLEDWALCTSSTSCSNGCCSAKYSKDGQLRCTRLIGGFHSDVCVQSSFVTEASRTRSSNNQIPPSGTCGSGSRGNGICPDGSCCSEHGWCGTTDAYCTHDDRSVPINGTCGDGNVGNGVCSDGSCCSEYGWCGMTDAYCIHDNSLPSNGTCGEGKIGNGKCADGSCCSIFGWCGITDDHCSHESVDEGAPLPINGTCGEGTIGNGICSDGSCCSTFGWCGTTEEYCSDASTPIPSLAPGTASPSGQGPVVNGTSSGPSPTPTSTAVALEKNRFPSTILWALAAVAATFAVVLLIVIYCRRKQVTLGSDHKNGESENPAESNGSAFKFWNWTRPATVSSHPEEKETYCSEIVVEPLEEQSIADHSMYTASSHGGRSDRSSMYALRYPASMVSVMGGSMAGFSVSGMSWPSARIDCDESVTSCYIQDSIAVPQEIEQPSV